MATLSFSYECTQVVKDQVIAGIAGQHNYQSEIEDPDNPGEMIPNPESIGAFVRRMAKQWAKQNVIAFEANQDSDAARDAAIERVENEVILT